LLNILKNFFSSQVKDDTSSSNDNLSLLCGLMVEAAYTDGSIDIEEIEKIKSVLVDSFKEDRVEVENILNKSINNKNNSKSLFYYTSKINKEYTKEKKIILIETLWEIVLSDNEIHEYESSLIRRLSGLLYISDVDSGNAKKRALNRISGK
tara:strand:+ start:401 stop:853 length:453 start_codon:yes stop_codon:yes gene_type:complete